MLGSSFHFENFSISFPHFKISSWKYNRDFVDIKEMLFNKMYQFRHFISHEKQVFLVVLSLTFRRFLWKSKDQPSSSLRKSQIYKNKQGICIQWYEVIESSLWLKEEYVPERVLKNYLQIAILGFCFQRVRYGCLSMLTVKCVVMSIILRHHPTVNTERFYSTLHLQNGRICPLISLIYWFFLNPL